MLRNSALIEVNEGGFERAVQFRGAEKRGGYSGHPPALGFFLPVAVVATSGVYNTIVTHLKNLH
jgi:hypothetical protein